MKDAQKRKKPSLRQALHREEGLTLIEIAVALVILSIVSLFLLSFFTNSASQSKLTNQRLSAGHLANARLHEVQSLPFSELQARATCSQGSLPDQSQDIYLLKTEVCSSSSKYTANPDILYISVTAYWLPARPGQSTEFRHKVSVTGAVKKDYALSGNGGNEE
ncbi:type IV pilus modification PilV family protein [Paenibacillus senegalimassiliensis]|uniref:type IV pilus modification PilV family protein n=1 Tax=Paenibacillus senegalimassiliensis TaxID=1737426 RepID=UPI00073F9081|nr:type II secretion system protein [Paenibacillus senegalimassiliensis]